MKQKTEKFVSELSLRGERTVLELIKDLENVLSENQYKYDSDLIVLSSEETDEYGSGYCCLEILGVRYETDEEYNARLLREKVDLLKKQREEIAKKENRFRQYLKLKEEFENDK